MSASMIEPEILPAARELGIGIVAYSVVAQGLLLGNIKTLHDSEAMRLQLNI
jgi:aryl-alcohol dehydrogenase-like predicted oxidoreductase